eukprot:scaffold20669_cov22-Prasinocladus_malaysianus.AAC.1
MPSRSTFFGIAPLLVALSMMIVNWPSNTWRLTAPTTVTLLRSPVRGWPAKINFRGLFLADNARDAFPELVGRGLA